MLFIEHPRGERLGGVVWRYRHPRLRDDFASVQLCSDPMNRAAVISRSVGERPGVGVEPLVERQQGGVDIEGATPPTRDEIRAQNTHEAGQT